MTIDPLVLLTIVGMAVATFATRITGVLLARRAQVSGRYRAWLDALPGAILVSMVAPSVLNGGLAEWLAAAAALAVTLRFGGILPAMVVGVGLVWILRLVTS